MSSPALYLIAGRACVERRPACRALAAAPARDRGSTIRRNLAFSPQYPLWSDGAAKRRWISLPPGTAIDASRPDAWEFPRGTRLWKEFSLDRPVETRFIERLPDGSLALRRLCLERAGHGRDARAGRWHRSSADARRLFRSVRVRLPRLPRGRRRSSAGIQRAAAVVRSRSARAARGRVVLTSTSTASSRVDSSGICRPRSRAAAHRSELAGRARIARLPARQLRALPQRQRHARACRSDARAERRWRLSPFRSRAALADRCRQSLSRASQLAQSADSKCRRSARVSSIPKRSRCSSAGSLGNQPQQRS